MLNRISSADHVTERLTTAVENDDGLTQRVTILRWFASVKTKVEEKSPFLFHFSSTRIYPFPMSRRSTLLLILFVLFVLWLWGNLSGLPWGIPCLFHKFTGLSCPACGTQRALFALLHGHPLTAWHYNYFLPFVGLLVIALAFLSRRKSPLYRTLTSPTALIIYGCIMLVWLIVRNLYGV